MPDEPMTNGVLHNFAVFAETDTSNTALVLRSATRRLDIVFGPNDESLKLVLIDENTDAVVKVLHADERYLWIRALREAVQWVAPEDDDA